MDIPLGEIFANGGVVGKVAIVHQSFMKTDKRMCPTRVPDFPFGRIAVVPEPDMSMQVFQLVVADNIIAFPDR